MDYFEVLAGDFDTKMVIVDKSEWLHFNLRSKVKEVERVNYADIESVEIATEETVKKAGGTIGWGAAGALVLGPAGLLAGLFLGGRKKEITFVMVLKDGRKVLGKAKDKSFALLQKAAF